MTKPFTEHCNSETELLTEIITVLCSVWEDFLRKRNRELATQQSVNRMAELLESMTLNTEHVCI